MSRRAERKQRLTELFVRKTRPQKRAYVVWDELQRGLALRVQPTGHRSWVFVYSRQGRPRWLHLGAADAIALSDARLMAAEAALAVAKGGDPAAEKRAQRGAGTFAELASKYVEQYAKKKNKSWPQAAALVRGHALPRWGKLQASSISRGDVNTMMARIKAPIVANQTLAAVSAIFSWGIKEEIVTVNPCKLVERNPTRARERILSASELPLFWKAFDDLEEPRIRGAALKAILLLGQRPGECAHMRREHIKDDGWWPGTKNAASHRVWIPAPVRELIGTGTAGFVFAGTRAAVTGLDAAMREICSKLDIERATPHDLRRTHGSTITALGFGRDAMNRIQNHKEGGITDTYDRHGYADENKRVMETVAAKIMDVIEGVPGANIIPFAR